MVKKKETTAFRSQVDKLIEAYADALSASRGEKTEAVIAAQTELTKFLTEIEGILTQVVRMLSEIKKTTHQKLH